MPEVGFALLWVACYVWGWQINMLDDYNFHTSFPEFEICKTRERLRWHGRKIFVVIFALLGNFWLYCVVWMAIVPHYFDYKVEEASGRIICPKTVGQMLRDMKGSAWGYIFFTGLMLCIMAVTMSFLSHLHFFAFKDFCKKESAEIGEYAYTYSALFHRMASMLSLTAMQAACLRNGVNWRRWQRRHGRKDSA